MQGVCIDPGPTTTLQEGETYFLFDHGQNNYYVSRFDNINAHFGSYQRSYFKVINKSNDNEKTQETKIQRFVAVVNRPRNGYRVGDKFLIGPSKYEPYFNVFLYDYPERGPIGSYIQNFFEILEPYIEPEKLKLETKQVDSVIHHVEVQKPHSEENKKPQRRKLNTYEQLEKAGQLSLFEV
ncbi:hypothetical protein [Heyndrickxia ginsengihumi]|uniref:hypothetical protein n=1 Tax=Heyndrickxia ginsengihumi TaxID=363870 RepID=UPI0004718DCC|nr:hypothetical protein [Heyndrickxia ginsengihumi]